MKLSRRGKRTKCAKRTKRFKLKRNTKKQFRQYKRKNTHRKHSRKLRKNKRVMRGGEGNVVELEYTTSDRFSKFKNFFGSLQKGNFTVSLSVHSYTISETRQDNKTMKDTLDSAVKIVNHPASRTQLVEYYFIPKTPDIFKFTLIMKKDDKVFQVIFEVKVKKYNFRLFKKENSGESYDIDLHFPDDVRVLVLGSDIENIDNPDDDGFTYSSGENFLKFDPYNGDNTFTIVQDGTEKKYTFPMKYGTTKNNSFFGIIYTLLIKKILEAYRIKLLHVLNKPQPPQHIAPEGSETSVPVSMDGEAQQQQQLTV